MSSCYGDIQVYASVTFVGAAAWNLIAHRRDRAAMFAFVQ
jgi:hypothetical protein